MVLLAQRPSTHHKPSAYSAMAVAFASTACSWLGCDCDNNHPKCADVVKSRHAGVSNKTVLYL